MDPGGFVVSAAVVFLASALQGSIGFGAGMVAAPAIALVQPALLPALVVMFACLLTLMVTWREKANLDLAGVGWALVGRLPGSVIGALMVVVLPVVALSWVVAVSVQVFVWLIPAVAAGFLLSRRLNRWMDTERLRLTGLLLALGGAVLLVVRLWLGA